VLSGIGGDVESFEAERELTDQRMVVLLAPDRYFSTL
jgi:hypothetical protein